MTSHETGLILKFLRGCYPAFYRNMTPLEWESVLLAWSTLFADDYYTYDMVFDAVKKCVSGKLRVRERNGMGTLEATDGGYRKFPLQPGVIAEALEGGWEMGCYARRLEAKRERRRLQAHEREFLPEGCEEDGQQDENRMVYAHVEPGYGLSEGVSVLLRPGAGELLRDERAQLRRADA